MAVVSRGCVPLSLSPGRGDISCPAGRDANPRARGCARTGVLPVELGGGSAPPGWVPSTHPEVQHPSCRLINCQLTLPSFTSRI